MIQQSHFSVFIQRKQNHYLEKLSGRRKEGRPVRRENTAVIQAGSDGLGGEDRDEEK